MAHATDILGYALKGDNYCLECIYNPLECGCPVDDRDENDLCQENCSGYGPHPIFRDQADGSEVCGECGEELE